MKELISFITDKAKSDRFRSFCGNFLWRVVAGDVRFRVFVGVDFIPNAQEKERRWTLENVDRDNVLMDYE
jgi:hypothetical protein